MTEQHQQLEQYLVFVDPVKERRNQLRRSRRILRTDKVPLSWSTPGHGVAKDSCGKLSNSKLGCLNVAMHPGHKVYVEHHRNTCRNPRCPVCSKKWVARESMRAADRIELASKQLGLPPKHIVLSVPVSLRPAFNRLDGYVRMRGLAYKIAKEVNILGGIMIFHAFRDDKTTFSPHFHVLGFGWVDDVKEVNFKSGWVIKNLGVRKNRKSIYTTLRYELDHCGIPQTRNNRSIVSPISWFGAASYNKLKVPKPEKQRCPHCGATLTRIRWWGTGDHPCKDLEEGDYLLDPGGWDYDDSLGLGDVYI